MRRSDTAATISLLVLLTLGAQPVQADPFHSSPVQAGKVYPSKGDVRRARQRAGAIGSQVARLQARLVQATAKVGAADLALSSAAEDFDSAQVELLASQRSAQAAAAAAQKAGQQLSGAQQQAGELAAATYRSGGSLAALNVVLGAGGPGSVLDRASMLRMLNRQRQYTVQRMDSARVVATTLNRQAAQAVAGQTVAAQRLAQARAVAGQRAGAAHALLTAEKVTRRALLVKLAAAAKTTVKIERARQAGLAKAAAARRAARQRREARASKGVASGLGSGNSGWAGPGGGSSSGTSASARSAVRWAIQQVGLPYQWGGAGPGRYDCSGLTMRAWQRGGVGMPHSARIQYQQVSKISYSALRPGDLVFYATDPSRPNTIHHVAMYIGGGRMIEAPYTGANVRIVGLRRGDSMPYAGRP